MACISRFFLIALCALVGLAQEASAVTLSGTVTTNGQPARYAQIFISGIAKPIRADKTGIFSVTVSKAGSYTLTPFPASNIVATPSNRVVSVGTTDITGLDFSLSRLTAKTALRGRITDPSGAALSNVSVYISSVGRVTTDANGIYSRKELPPARYALSATAPGVVFAPAVRQIKARAGRAIRTAFRGRPLPSGVNVATYLSGVFDLSLTRSSGQCATLPSSLKGVATVNQREDRVRLTLPSLGTETFDAKPSGFGGMFSRNRVGCTASGSVEAVYSTPEQALVSGNIQIICPGQSNCTGSFTGSLTRK